jgi:large repetitive protein
MKHKLLITAFSLFACFAAFAQPANNNCNTAQSLGTLPTPAPCPSGVGATVSVAGTNVGATGANPYTYLLGCQPAGNQAAPALDVWYSFTATGNQVIINMSGSLPSPNVAMWTGPCNNLVGFDCAIGTAGGNLSVTFEPTAPGQTYYLQVSGNTPVSTGTFTLTVSNNNDCSDCLQISNLTVSPAPVNGTYGPNQTVTFCYTITSWTQVSANWLHGVTPSFGCGWNLATLAPSGSPPPGGSGYDWFWGNGPNGWGWWVDFDPVGPGSFDGNFTNNYGDPTITGTGNWTFCWSITTAATCACPNLNMTINTTSDGETGNWTSIACQNDAVFQFSALMNCCSVSATGTNVTCNGASTGTATATPLSGTGPYTYSWAPTGGTAATATGLPAGTYTVTQTDNNGCVSVATVTITQPPAITLTPTQTNVTCNGVCNGTASVVATGGTGTYTYVWAPGGQTTSSITGQCAGSYTVTVSSPAGCTRTQTFTITQPPAITLTPTQTNVTCFGACTGSASVVATGGTGTYTYVWAPGGQTTAGITGQCAGSYTVTVSSPAGCTRTQTFTITQPPALTLTPTQTNITCNGVCTGSASVVATGGNGTYTYLWAPGGQTTSSIAGQCAGSYTVTVSSPAGCTATQTYTITQPPAITITPTQTNVTCFGSCNGSATGVATGGTGTYTYVWAPAPGGGQGTATATGLCAGTYTLTVSSPAGCTRTQTYTITSPPAITLTPTQTNVTCNGACTGTASVTATGGTGTYTYAWAPGGQTTASITGQCAGSYTVTVSSPAGCTATQTYTITQPPAITVTPTQTNVTCFGACTGTASVVATGGTGTYTYLWAPGGQTTASITGQCAGSYTVTVSSPAGCTRTQTFSITQPPAITLTPTQTNILCNGSCTGAASVVATGGNGTYTYAWAPGGQTTAGITGQCAGSYTVTVSSPAGCTATQTFNITAPPVLTSTGSQTNILCNGTCTGSASVTPSGGVGPYTYVWAPSGGTSASATGLCVNSYTVTFTDANGCTGTRTFSITQPPALSSTITATAATCNMANGSAAVTVSGGVGPYTYSWAPTGGTSATTTGRPAGTYTVTFTDANGCTGTASVTIINNAAPTATITATVNVTCFGASTGGATVSASGGTGPYTYSWAPTGGTSATTTGRPAGTYTVTVTDANGCTVQATVTITQPPAITLTPTQTNVLCNGGTTGSASVTATGGTGTYTYSWAPSGGTGSSATGLGAGTYTVTVSSPAGCTATQTYNITAPPALTSTGSQTNVLCNGGSTGSASVSVSGGVGPYTYAWAPTGGTAATATGLSATSYTVTFTDANGCTGTRTFTITQPPALTASTSFTQATCNMSNGSASVSVSGGVGPYTYLWTPSGGTGATATGLAANTYTVTYTDANGCTGTASVTVPNAAAPTATITATTNVSCFGGNNGSATVAASGGTGPYTYAWSPIGGTGATGTNLTAQSYTVVVTDANGCTTSATTVITQPIAVTASASSSPVLCNGGSTGSATVTPGGGVGPYTYAWAPTGGTAATATGLNANTYTVTVTDANGCTTTATTTVTQPTALTATAASSPVLCNGGSTGSATVTPAGGTAPYTYSWAPTGGTAATATGLTAQGYTVTVTDANGCTVTATTTVTQPPALSATTSFTQATCNMSNGSASVSVSGGVGPYTYTWAPSGGTAATATGLSANTYTVTFTDANGCTGTASVTVPNAGSPTATITATTNVSCFGGNNGSATVAASGGTAPYTYAWSPIGGTGTTGTSLTAQSYTVTVTDVNGCSTTATTTITQPPVLTATAASSPVVCFGGSTGSATVTATGGVTPYSYSWTPSGGTGATATGLNANTYTVTVTDANGCTTTATTTVTQPTAVTATASMTPVLCNGGTTGTATATPGGGIGPYTYMWTPSMQTTAIATGLSAQSYTVTVTDANGCTVNATVTVTQPTALTATTSFTQATCNASNGSASVSVSGGVGPYTYSWTPSGGTAATATSLAANTYTVTFTDANGCTGSASVTVPNAGSPTATITATTNVSCFGGSNGSATVAASGGTGPYTYSWSPSGGTGTTASGLNANSYTVTVTDANGCSTTASTTITQPPVLGATAASSPVLCFGGSTGSATVTATGGVGPYTYSWAPIGGTNAIATGLTAQSYTATVTDANGCSTTATTTVTQPTAVTATASMSPVLCNGGNTGSATVTPGGGIGPYTYSWSPSAQTTATAINLTAQGYTVIVTDANGCSTTASVTVTQPTALSATTSFTQATCNASNGSASVTVTGGIGPYTYAWSPTGGTAALATGLSAQTYTVTFTDANNCSDTAQVTVPNAGAPAITITGTTDVLCFGGNNGAATTNTAGGTAPYTYAWSPTGGTGANGTGMIAGNYTVTVTDANNCSASATTTITEPPLLTSSAVMTPVLCNGDSTGTATATGTGGVTPYTYVWSPSSQITQTATTLTAQTYSCVITDANGCSSTATVTVTEPTALTSTISGVDILCNGGNNGSATVTPSGGTGPYTYNWTPGPQSTQTATALFAGNYSCDITDANGCSITLTIVITEPGALSATTSFTQSTCGASNGFAAVTCTLGVQPYTYLWSPLGGTGATTVGVPTGNYTCVISDANGCTLTATVNVPSAAGPTATIAPPTMVTCFGGANGEAIVTPNGGTGPYSYSWSNGDLDSIAGGLIAGNYSVTVTDANGCTATATVLIVEPTLLSVQANAAPSSVCEGTPVSLSASAGGGTPAYQFDWTPGPLNGPNQTVTPLVSTTFVVTVTDANGCTVSQPVSVTVSPLPTPTFTADVTSGCATLCVNFSDLTTISSGSVTGWSWDFGDGNTSTAQNPSHCYTDAGVYSVTLTVTSAAGCTQTIVMTNYITVFANPVANFGASPQPTTILDPEICFTDSSTLADQWSWNFGDVLNSSSTDQNPCFTYLDPTCYLVTLTVTSPDGCTAMDTQTVCITPDVSIYVPNTFTPNGNGLNDVFIPVTIGIDPDQYELWIFDRWGNMIWYTDDLDEGWDGIVQGHTEIVQIDTYVWKIKAKDVMGNQHNLIGHVNVIK